MFSLTTAFVAYGLMAVASATPLFQNHGTRSGWNKYNEEAHGKVEERDNVWYEPGTSLKMTQTYDPNYKERYHSEAIKTNVYTVGDEGFYGFAFRLSEKWDMSSADQSYVIAQTIANLSTNEHNTCGDDWIPSMSKSLMFLQERLYSDTSSAMGGRQSSARPPQGKQHVRQRWDPEVDLRL